MPHTQYEHYQYCSISSRVASLYRPNRAISRSSRGLFCC